MLHAFLVYAATLKHQCVACPEHHLVWTCLNALAATCHSHEHHVVRLLIIGFHYCLAYQGACEGNVCSAYLPAAVYVVEPVYMFRSTHKLVALLQLQYRAYVAAEYQAVAAKHIIIVIHGRNDFLVETHYLNQTSAIDVGKSALLHRVTHNLRLCRDKKLNSIVADRLKRLVGRLAVGKHTTHGNDRENEYTHAEQTRKKRLKERYHITGLFLVKTSNDKVGRRTDDGAHATQTGCIAQRNEHL